MTYRFRLTFFKSLPSFFQFEEESVEIEISDYTVFTLTARDKAKLCEATNFHIEGKGYESEDDARKEGEKVRLHMQVINSLLGLELNIPDSNTASSTFADHVKEKLKAEQGIILVDSIRGLNIFSDSDNFIEKDITGYGDVFPNNPKYIIDALVKSWSIDFGSFSSSKDTTETVNILNSAEKEKSLRVKFLLTYAALERVVEKLKRSKEEMELIETFKKQLNDSQLQPKQKEALSSTLANLNYRSLKHSLIDKLDKLPNLKEIQGKPVMELVNEAVDIRNKIAHRASIGSEETLSGLIDKLRIFVMHLIWNTHQLPNFTIDRPPSQVAMHSMDIRVIK